MNKILLDTSVVIDFLRRKDKENTILYTLLNQNLFISIITHTELFGGKSAWEDKKAKNQLTEFLTGVAIIPLNEDISKQAGYIKAHNYSKDTLDAIIAATAKENNYELVTLNRKDFIKIPGLKLFKENSIKN